MTIDAPGGRRLRVLVGAFACNPYGRGGGEDVLGWNVVSQIARFHETWVITSNENRPDIEDELARQPLPNTRFVYFGVPFGASLLRKLPGVVQSYAYLWQIGAYLAVRSLHRKVHFDLFHHVTYANDWMASFMGALLPLPYVRGPGGGAHRTPTAFLSTYSISGRLWERFRRVGQWFFRHDPFFILGQHRAKAIMVCNQEALNALPPGWHKKATLFPVNGVSTRDISLLATSPPKTDNPPFRVLSAGKLVRLKAFPLAISAFKLFADTHEDIKLEIIGDGPDRTYLEKMVDGFKLNDQVSLSNWMERSKFLQRLESCDVFLFPSLRDGGGAVVVEAMAAGKPVVCLAIGGPGLHVTDECGITVIPDSPEQTVKDIAAALGVLYADERLRLRMGESARKRAKSAYHWDSLGDRLNAIYAQAIGIDPVAPGSARAEDP